MTLEETWSESQIRTFTKLAEGACDLLAKRSSISAEEISRWDILDGDSFHTRGHSEVPTAKVIALGKAIAALVNGELPAAPKGTMWFFGMEGDPTTIQMRETT